MVHMDYKSMTPPKKVDTLKQSQNTMTMILGALVIMPSIRWPMAEPAAIRERIDRPTPAWMSCKIIMIIMMMILMMLMMMMMMMMTIMVMILT